MIALDIELHFPVRELIFMSFIPYFNIFFYSKENVDYFCGYMEKGHLKSFLEIKFYIIKFYDVNVYLRCFSKIFFQ